ncbi:MAG: lipocalin-like domain-containing protein [Actinomycetota bacterium]|nr:lipocalin-like domain-containing protein [Actinomycetota bacterium]
MHALVGTWRLVEWTVSIGGRTVRPFGGSAVGLLTYTDEGRMMASLMRQDREMLDTSSFAGAQALNRAGAAAGYISYAGSYEIVGDEVHHDVELSLFPDWVGATQSRRIEWVEESDGQVALQLSYVQPGAGKEATNTLRWHRIVPKGKA